MREKERERERERERGRVGGRLGEREEKDIGTLPDTVRFKKDIYIYRERESVRERVREWEREWNSEKVKGEEK